MSLLGMVLFHIPNAYTQNEWSSGFCSREGIKAHILPIYQSLNFFQHAEKTSCSFSLGRGKGVDPQAKVLTHLSFGVCYLHLSTFDKPWFVCGGGWAGVESHDNMYRHYQPLEKLSSLCGHQFFGDLWAAITKIRWNDPCNTPGWRGRPFECTQHKYKDTRRVAARKMFVDGGSFQYSKLGAFQKFWFETKWDRMTFHLEISWNIFSEVAEKQSSRLIDFWKMN